MVLLCAAVMTACSEAAEPPTIEAAVEQLSSDADDLLGAAGLGTVETVEDDSCVPGQVRALLRAESDASASLLAKLHALGYAEVIDDLDFREDQDVSVLRHPGTLLTFELTMLVGEQPGVRIVGKTTCYATG
ncbi:hypothetical protein ABZ897_09185 [Nonomuraea sp. NPDC046802]|uniref:hypothetical protein n=1 Tax=Nonomuraea sp. NPDC046802 TaxID=3154919 RepID=UPI0034069B6E